MLDVFTLSQVHVIGALPLRNLSRVWGYVNSLELPEWARPMGFRFYAWAFGCNLDEIEKDLKEYTSLGDFFYRKLKDGSRPVADVVLVRSSLPSGATAEALLNVSPNRSALPMAQYCILAPLPVAVWSR